MYLFIVNCHFIPTLMMFSDATKFSELNKTVLYQITALFRVLCEAFTSIKMKMII